MEMEGIIESGNKDIFMVKITDDYCVRCTISGKLRKNGIKLLEGDQVKIEVSEYETTKGRITYRIK